MQNRLRLKKKAVKEKDTIIKNLEERLGIVDPKVQEKALVKVGILKNLVWKDGVFTVHEEQFLTKYILESNDIEADVKISLLKDLSECPHPFFAFFEKEYKKLDLKETAYMNRILKSEGEGG